MTAEIIRLAERRERKAAIQRAKEANDETVNLLAAALGLDWVDYSGSCSYTIPSTFWETKI